MSVPLTQALGMTFFRLLYCVIARAAQQREDSPPRVLPALYLLIMLTPILWLAEIQLMPAPAAAAMRSFLAAHPGRDLYGAIAFFLPKAALFAPILYWIFLSRGARAAQVRFDDRFAATIDSSLDSWKAWISLAVILGAIPLMIARDQLDLAAALSAGLLLANEGVSRLALRRLQT